MLHNSKLFIITRAMCSILDNKVSSGLVWIYMNGIVFLLSALIYCKQALTNFWFFNLQGLNVTNFLGRAPGSSPHPNRSLKCWPTKNFHSCQMSWCWGGQKSRSWNWNKHFLKLLPDQLVYLLEHLLEQKILNPRRCKALKGGTTSPGRMQRFTVHGVNSLLSTNTQREQKCGETPSGEAGCGHIHPQGTNGEDVRQWTGRPKQPQADQGDGRIDAHSGGSQRCYFKEGRSQLITL